MGDDLLHELQRSTESHICGYFKTLNKLVKQITICMSKQSTVIKKLQKNHEREKVDHTLSLVALDHKTSG